MDTVKGSAAPLTVNTWTPTEKNEMQTFLGLTVLMGIVYKPRLAMYWSMDLVYKASISGDSMAQDRFLHLLRFIHFADNDCLDTSDHNRDRLHYYRSIRPGTKTGDPVVTDIVSLCYKPDGTVLFKLSFDEEWAPLPEMCACRRKNSSMLCRHCMAQVCQ